MTDNTKETKAKVAPNGSVEDVSNVNDQVPTNDTEKAAVQAVNSGSDEKFDDFVKRSEEQGNPEQYSPMQEEQNARDRANRDANEARDENSTSRNSNTR